IYPLVRELAEDGIPVTVTCRVLKIARQPYYRWLDQPVTAAELEQAYRAHALFEAHSDDPEFGYRLLSAYSLTCRSGYGLMCRSVFGESVSFSP
ncbi:MAG: Integrase catalytic region, partial [Ramlibacter sp.]|nr:Integrase catalytic region [Ramlibacter sp.]